MPEKELTPPSYLPAMQFPSAFTAIPGSLHPGMQFFRGFLVLFLAHFPLSSISFHINIMQKMFSLEFSPNIIKQCQ